MLAYAYEHADTEQRKILDIVGREDLSDSDIAQLQQVVMNTGAKDAMEQRIVTLVEQAISALNPAELANETYAPLTALAHAVTQRDA
jgi:geranylgeranyl diphosphate synthase type I